MIELLVTPIKGAQDNSDLPFPAGTPYKGVVPSASFITGDALAAAIGLTAGESMNSNAGWLHYIEDTGLELYIAKKPMRVLASWEQINTAQAGNTKEVTINGDVYVVRFVNGLTSATNYAWQRYLLNVYNPLDRAQFPANTPIWGSYGDSMLGVETVANAQHDGTHSICAEPYSNGYATRGNTGGQSSTTQILAQWFMFPNTPQRWYGWRPLLVKKSTMPPPPFRGEVAQADFITFAALATATGLTAGAPINTTEPWLHIVTAAGLDLYMPRKPIRNNLTWESLSALGMVTGTKTVVINSKTYKVRLLKVYATDSGGNTTAGREWSDLILGLVNGTYANYTAAQLGTGTGGTTNGELNIGQEPDNRGGHAAGGYPDINSIWYINPGTTNTGYGWRPVLELVP